MLFSKLDYNEESINHYCGLFSVVSKYPFQFYDITKGISQLQHRGQDSAGTAYITNTNPHIQLYKGLGLVDNVFSKSDSPNELCFAGISHVRYSTRKKTTIEKQLQETQPFVVDSELGTFALAHNGNIPNIKKLQDKYDITIDTESDSLILAEIIRSMIKIYKYKTFDDVLIKFVNEIAGVYCILILTENEVYAIKDSSGVRPLCYGFYRSKHDSDNIANVLVFASESIALTECGCTSITEVDVGQIVAAGWKDNTIGGVEQYGMLSELIQPRIVYTKPDVIGTFCSFEYIYFFRHNSTYNGKNVEQVRMNLGKQLALQCKTTYYKDQNPLSNSIVVCVPQTSIASAKGFAAEMEIPFDENAIVKNFSINRTFILPNDKARQDACEQKFIFSDDRLYGKNIYLIDDSIVRGNTLKSIVKKLKNCGVRTIHVRIPSPPIVSECYYGIDMSTKSELIAYKYSIEEMIKIFDVDSLIFISIENMKLAFGNNENVCTSCFTGKYDDKLLDW